MNHLVRRSTRTVAWTLVVAALVLLGSSMAPNDVATAKSCDEIRHYVSQYNWCYREQPYDCLWDCE